jgi:nicotinamidase-related amidase
MDKQPILMDIHVQRDIFVPGGALYSPEHRKAAANIYRLFDWAKSGGVPVISSVLLVRPGRRGPLSDTPHCVEGTPGEQKLARTLLPRRVNLGLSPNADLPREIFSHVQQVIFESRDVDLFNHMRFERLITELPEMCEFVLCGASITLGIKQAVLGLRNRGHSVVLAEDAVVDLGHPLTEMSWLQVLAKSARPLPTVQIIHELPLPRRRVQIAQHVATE